MTQKKIQDIITESIKVKEALLLDHTLLEKVEKSVSLLTIAFQNKKKVLFCGNGGSAADAQHIAAELSGRFYIDRPALYAEALHVNTSYLTAVANDYSYDVAYARLIEGIGHAGDVLVAISTSGNSKNILNAIASAKLQNMSVIGMTGATGGKMSEVCDILLNVPSTTTPRIQESHIMLGHILCEMIELNLFTK